MHTKFYPMRLKEQWIVTKLGMRVWTEFTCNQDRVQHQALVNTIKTLQIS
jgi:hypothetical protein